MFKKSIIENLKKKFNNFDMEEVRKEYHKFIYTGKKLLLQKKSIKSWFDNDKKSGKNDERRKVIAFYEKVYSPFTSQEERERLLKTNTYHEFHLVDPSPWPFLCAWGAFFTATGLVQFMHNYAGGKNSLIFGLFVLLYGTFFWFRDIIREATYENKHTPIVKRGLAKAMLLFILSESMFFFAVFWAFIYTAAAPAIHVGSLWPPKATPIMDPSGVAIANSGVLVASGICASWAHYEVGYKENDFRGAVSLLATTILSVIFLGFQYDEYLGSPFVVSDSSYGSCFFLVTGCHGLHVFIGTVAIVVAGCRTYAHHFTPDDMMGLDFTVWYWHFVDFVWLAVFLLIYEWGNYIAEACAVVE